MSHGVHIHALISTWFNVTVDVGLANLCWLEISHGTDMSSQQRPAPYTGPKLPIASWNCTFTQCLNLSAHKHQLFKAMSFRLRQPLQSSAASVWEGSCWYHSVCLFKRKRASTCCTEMLSLASFAFITHVYIFRRMQTPLRYFSDITYLFLKFNGVTVEVWEWIGNFFLHFIMDTVTYPCWD